ncbi:hypothetical protein GQ472_00935 [archaeon]|nr:hypothetical protein [archaeon]
MKSVFLAGSRKFFDDIEKSVLVLKNNNINVATAGKWDNTQEDSLESEKSALLRAFKEIDRSDIVYIYAVEGHIGKTVAMEIAYAYARKKELIALHEIEDFSAQALISKVIDISELVEYCK